MLQRFNLLDDLYNEILNSFTPAQNFIEWDDTDNLKQGKICWSYAWYEKDFRWYLKTHNYKPSDESESTWTAHRYSLSGNNMLHDEYVKKYFCLEDEENLVSVPGKYRPVILIKEYNWDWMQPSVPGNHIKKWLVMPIFCYKPRHENDYRYKVNDFCFKTPDRVFMPKMYGTNAGMEEECCVHLNTIQLIRSDYIKPYKVNYTSSTSKKGIMISEKALKILIYHHMKHLQLFNVFDAKEGKKEDSDKSEYDVFVWAVIDAVKIALKKQSLPSDFV